MKIGSYYRLKSGNIFKVMSIKNNLCTCSVVGKYDVFYMEEIEGEQLLFDGEMEEINPSTLEKI